MNRKSRKWAALAVLVVFGLVGASSASFAGAQDPANPWWVDRYEIAPELQDDVKILEVRPNGRVSFEFPMSRFYGLAEHGLVVLTGADLLTFCTNDAPDTMELVTYRAEGEFVTRTPPGGSETRTYVYETGAVDGLPWMFGACAALEADGTAPPAPKYSGMTTLRVRSNPDVPLWASVEQPPGHYRNGVEGVVSDVDGNQFTLSTFVNFPLTGLEQGPPDFIRHDVTLTPVAG